MVQPSIFTRYPLPGTPIRTASCRGVYRHSIYPTRKAYEEPEGSRRLCSLAIRRREGVSGPRVVPPFIFTRHPPPGRRTGGPRVVQSSIFARYPSPERPVRTLSGPGVHLYSPSTAVKAFPDRERSSRSYSLAIGCQEGVSGPRMVQPFIFIRYPPPGRRIRTPSGPSSLAIRRREGVFG